MALENVIKLFIILKVIYGGNYIWSYSSIFITHAHVLPFIVIDKYVSVCFIGAWAHNRKYFSGSNLLHTSSLSKMSEIITAHSNEHTNNHAWRQKDM